MYAPTRAAGGRVRRHTETIQRSLWVIYLSCPFIWPHICRVCRGTVESGGGDVTSDRANPCRRTPTSSAPAQQPFKRQPIANGIPTRTHTVCECTHTHTTATHSHAPTIIGSQQNRCFSLWSARSPCTPRPATPSAPSLSAVTRRSPCTAPSVALWPRSCSSVASRWVFVFCLDTCVVPYLLPRLFDCLFDAWALSLSLSPCYSPNSRLGDFLTPYPCGSRLFFLE